MRRSQRSLTYLAVAIPVLLVLAATLYMVGMSVLEGEPRTFTRSLEFAAETLTTTGYGADARWRHPLMVGLVILLQFTGLFMVFLIFPLYLIPWMEERFESRLPVSLKKPMQNHIVIFRSGPAVQALIDQIEESHRRVLILESDEAAARRLIDRGETVLYMTGDNDAVQLSNLLEATALIANGLPEENVSLILRARQAGFDKPIYALVEEPEKRRALELAGATAVYTPRHILGDALAARASHRISPRVAGLGALGGKIGIRGIRILPDSPLAGKQLDDLNIGADSGILVLSIWKGGTFISNPSASTVLEPNSLVILGGPADELETHVRETEGASELRSEGPIVIAGYGEVGSKVAQLIRDAGDETITIDLFEREGVDIIGNVLDDETLRKASIDRASAVVIALDTDDAMTLATIMIRDLDPHVPIVARVNKIENIETIHRAGADFALSVSQVTGQMLSGRILGYESLSIDAHFRLVKVPAESLAGQSLAELDVRARTGCSIVAIERGNDVVLGSRSDLTIEPDDSLYICGGTESIRSFRETFLQ